MYKTIFLLLSIILIAQSCNKTKDQTMDSDFQYTNELINETSPYLLQHAHNPVNWYAWNDETLELAKKEDKLLLIL